uniref:Uncharacterized protein n=1 Tax=Rhizophora mucronata TaxID=61149 RepID=A0A2P2JP19_RHIMU
MPNFIPSSPISEMVVYQVCVCISQSCCDSLSTVNLKHIVVVQLYDQQFKRKILSYGRNINQQKKREN